MWILNIVLWNLWNGKTITFKSFFMLMISLSQAEAVVGNEETVRVNYDLQLFCRIREDSSWFGSGGVAGCSLRGAESYQ